MERVLALLGAPPGAPYRAFTIGLLWVGLLLAVACAVLGQLPIDPVWAIICGALAGSVLFSLLVIAWFSRSLVRDMRQIQAGDHFVHWRYTADEWARFEEAEWGQARRETRLAPIFGAVVGAIAGVIAWLVSGEPMLGLALSGILLLIGFVVAALTWIGGRWRRSRPRSMSPEVYVSVLGVIQPSGYRPLKALNLSLAEAEVIDGAVPVLRLTTRSRGESGLTHNTSFRIPIPAGQVEEAERVAQRLLNESRA